MLLGAHVSIAGGVSNAPDRGVEIGAEALAIFCKNQRRWVAKPYTEEEVEAFRAAVGRTGLDQIVVHDSYLINMGCPRDELWQRSRAGFVDELLRCTALGVPFLNFHPGSHLGEGEGPCIERIATTVAGVLDEAPPDAPMLLLENTAGQGTNVGYSLDHLADLLEQIDDDRVGVCVDTQHTFAAGYDLREEAGYDAFWDEFDDKVGMQNLRAFHLNDSKSELGSKVDRHEEIGEGAIGLPLFARLVNDERFAGIPGILETPGGMEGWKHQIARLKALRAPEAPDAEMVRHA